MKSSFPLLSALLLCLACGNTSTGDGGDPGDDGSPDGEAVDAAVAGVWNRFGSEYGYMTDVMYGGIGGEPANRVYMCELPGSPSAGLYKGLLVNPRLIRWDAEHNLPDYEVVFEGEVMRFLPQNGTGTFLGKYQRGTWTPGACELKMEGDVLKDASRAGFVYRPANSDGTSFRVQSVKVGGVSLPIVSSIENACNNAVKIPGGSGTELIPVSVTYSAEGVSGPYTHTVSSWLSPSELTMPCNRIMVETGCGSLEACIYVDNAPLPEDPAAGLSCNSGALGSGPSLSTTTDPISVALADFNGDGRKDVATAGANGVSVMLNQGSGTFSAEATFSVYATSIVAADVTDDGKADLVVSGWDSSQGGVVAVLRNQGNGTFAQPVKYTVGGQLRQVVAGDITGDSKADVAVLRVSDSTYPQNALILLNNNGTGAFSVSAQHALPYAFGVDIGDLNGDGRADVVTNIGSAVGIHLSQANGTLAARVDYPAAIQVYPYDVNRMGDVNGDGKLDVVALGHDVNNPRIPLVHVLLNTGTGTFSAAQATSPGFSVDSTPSTALADVNGDGTLDVVSRSGDTQVGIALGKGSATFAAPTFYSLSDSASRGLALGDVTGDGKPDVVFSATGLKVVSVMTNQCP